VKSRRGTWGALGYTLTPIPDFGLVVALDDVKLKTFMHKINKNIAEGD